MTSIAIRGVGFWSPGIPSSTALASGRRDESAVSPTPTLASRRHLRYTSDVTRMAIAACEEAITATEVPLDQLNVVFASSQGEVQIAVELLDMIAAEGSASPARFMNSVHNTMGGHVSIASKSHGFFTALAGARQTVSGAVIEAFALLRASEFESVALVVADERLPAPVDLEDYESMAMALMLERTDDANSSATIEGIVRDATVAPFVGPPALAQNPCSAAIGVLAAIAEKKSGLVRLDGPGCEGWCAELSFRA